MMDNQTITLQYSSEGNVTVSDIYGMHERNFTGFTASPFDLTVDDTNLTALGPTEANVGDTVACGVFFFIVYGPLFGLICLLGLIGNCLSWAVLHKYSKSNVATYLLKALAVSDSLFLATASFVQMYPAMSMYFNLTEQLRPIYPKLQMYAWPIAHIVQMGTVYMMVLVAANRYIAVCKPLHAPRLCTKRQVQTQLIIMTAGIIIYNIPRFFEYKYQRTEVVVDNVTTTVEENIGLIEHKTYNIVYENVSYCLFVFLIPLLILIVLNVHLVQELKKAQQNRKAISSRKNADENNITLVMIVIILVFIVCQTPASINQILFYTIGQSNTGDTCTDYEKYYHISNVLITTNSSLNFIIYCLFRRQFQQELVSLLCCGKVSRAKRPLPKTLILKALHEQSSSFTSSFSHAVPLTVESSVLSKTCDVTTAMNQTADPLDTSCRCDKVQNGITLTDRKPVTSSTKQCNGIKGHDDISSPETLLLGPECSDF